MFNICLIYVCVPFVSDQLTAMRENSHGIWVIGCTKHPLRPWKMWTKFKEGVMYILVTSHVGAFPRD